MRSGLGDVTVQRQPAPGFSAHADQPLVVSVLTRKHIVKQSLGFFTSHPLESGYPSVGGIGQEPVLNEYYYSFRVRARIKATVDSPMSPLSGIVGLFLSRTSTALHAILLRRLVNTPAADSANAVSPRAPSAWRIEPLSGQLRPGGISLSLSGPSLRVQ